MANHITYIGARYVPKFAQPAQWSKENEYEPLTIVLNQGNSYTSRRAVPKGIDLKNDEYWAMTGNYNAQIELYRAEVDAFDGRIKNAQDTANTANSKAVAAQATADANTTAIAAETERAQGEEAYLEGEISRVSNEVAAETERATGAEAVNAAAIAAETERARAAENSNAGKIAQNAVDIKDVDKRVTEIDNPLNKIEMLQVSSFDNEFKTSYAGLKIPRAAFKFNVANCDGGYTNRRVSNAKAFMIKHPNAVIGSNCNFASTSETRPMRINGVNFNTEQPAHAYPLLAVNTDTQEIKYYEGYTKITSVPETYNFVFSVSHKLVEGGTALSDFPTRLEGTDWNTSIAPRLGFGYDLDNYYLLWCEGRMLHERGMKMRDFAATLKREYPGIIEAYNFDGGGSITVAANTPRTTKLNIIKDFKIPFWQLRATELVFYFEEVK